MSPNDGEITTESTSPAQDQPQEFPEKIYCPQCRQVGLVRLCQARCNTLLTEVQILCPKCRRKLSKMRLKDWYDHYVQQIEPPPKVSS